MTCESNPNQIAQSAAQFAGGISRLASKRSFYAGIAVGAAGTGGAMFVVNRFRRSKDGPPGQSSRKPISDGGTSLPALLPGSSNKPNLRKLPIPPIKGTRSHPQKIPIETLTKAAERSQANSAKKTVVRRKSVGRMQHIPVPILSAPLPDTKLQPAEIKIEANGQIFTPKTSYRVLTTDGRDIGLAITPEVIATDDTGELAEQENSWCVTHTRTGQLISGPYDTVNKAQKLATQLAPFSWAATMSRGEIGQAQQIIEAYRHSLTGGKD